MASIGLDGDFEGIVCRAVGETIKEVNESLETNASQAADMAVRLLRSESAKRTGKYRRAWASKRESTSMGAVHVVYNKRYQLTHLLEKPHAIWCWWLGRYVGHTQGDHVIASVYDRVAAEFGKGAS